MSRTANFWEKVDSMSSFDFSENIEGQLYHGKYTVIRENIMVTCEFGKKTIRLGHTHAKILARMVLGEIVRDELRRRGSSLGLKAPASLYSPLHL